MPIASTDIKLFQSTSGLGGAITATEIVGGVANNIFDDVLSAEASSGDTEYRGFYVKNNHGTLTLQNAVIWIDVLTSSASTEFDIALAAEAINVTMATIANESTAPATVTFSRPTSKATGLSIGNLAALATKGVWIRRTVSAAAAAASDSGSLRVDGDTAA